MTKNHILQSNQFKIKIYFIKTQKRHYCMWKALSYIHYKTEVVTKHLEILVLTIEQFSVHSNIYDSSTYGSPLLLKKNSSNINNGFLGFLEFILLLASCSSFSFSWNSHSSRLYFHQLHGCSSFSFS